MKLKKYIKQKLKEGARDFNIGVEPDMEVNPDSPDRIRFSVRRK